ncbi:DUF3631 domain-containing protein [Rhodococcus koreensis]|uniref:DUF3631 domain-containing protein n=1 Tax=Rhodococcus koreensis TaxID=99653 RepID=UPI00367092F3
MTTSPLTNPADVLAMVARHKTDAPDEHLAPVIPLRAPLSSTETAETPPPEVQAPAAAESLLDALDAAREHFAKYVRTSTPEDLDILALWAVHTHLCLETYTSPRLVLDSPLPGSGKTTVLEHLERLSVRPVQMSSIGSPALLVRMLSDGIRTILIDEADRSLSPNKPGIEDIIAVLNSGYKRGATRPVLVPDKENGWVAKEMPTFSPVAMAGNAPQLPDDTRSRCITVLLMPAAEGEVAETDWELIDDEVRALGARIVTAADAVRDVVAITRPELPKGCIGRAKERWLPLKRVAAVASDEWAQRVDRLVEMDMERDQLARDEGLTARPPHVVLLHDIYAVFGTETWMETKALVSCLIARNPASWSAVSAYGKDLTSQRLGRMLTGRYRIHSGRPDSYGPRGYSRTDFDAAFRALRVGEDTPA